jgi:hypothetical protein
MANLRIENSSMCVHVEYDFHLLKGNLSLTAGYQCFVYKGKNGEISVDIDFSDITNVKFFDQEIDSSYREYNIWKENMLKIGIDIEKITNEECYNSYVELRITNMLKNVYGGNKFHN